MGGVLGTGSYTHPPPHHTTFHTLLEGRGGFSLYIYLIYLSSPYRYLSTLTNLFSEMFLMVSLSLVLALFSLSLPLPSFCQGMGYGLEGRGWSRQEGGGVINTELSNPFGGQYKVWTQFFTLCTIFLLVFWLSVSLLSSHSSLSFFPPFLPNLLYSHSSLSLSLSPLFAKVWGMDLRGEVDLGKRGGGW